VVRSVTAELAARARIDAVIGSANGSALDALEAGALEAYLPDAPVSCPKAALGEALGAGALMQVITAALALKKQELPPVKSAGSFAPAGLVREAACDAWLKNALVVATGFNQQASGAVLTLD
jgi:3-oxoacyl-(acyl-carrier-protein) synthase